MNERGEDMEKILAISGEQKRATAPSTEKQELFNIPEPAVEVRRSIEATKSEIRRIFEQCNSQQISLEDANTALRDIYTRSGHILQRLYSFEGMARLFGSTSNDLTFDGVRSILKGMFRIALEETDTENQDRLFGILGARLDQEKLIELQEKGTIAGWPKEVLPQLKREMIHARMAAESLADPQPERFPDTHDDAIDTQMKIISDDLIYQGIPAHNPDRLSEHIHAMGRLYHDDPQKLQMDFGVKELKVTLPRKESAKDRFVRGDVSGLRLLREGEAPSERKVEQAKRVVRIYPENERGKIIPLRVFVLTGIDTKSAKYLTLPQVASDSFITAMQGLRVRGGNRAVGKGELAAAKNQVLRDTKRDFLASLTPAERTDFVGQSDVPPERISLRIETLVDENRLGKLVRKLFGKTQHVSVDSILQESDPSGELKRQIDEVLVGGDEEEKTLAKIEQLIRERQTS